ncbi:hypothetical protein QFZ99_002959 [Paraburkholderia atlantica]
MPRARAQVGMRAVRCRLQTPRRFGGERQPLAADQMTQRAPFVRAQRVEIAMTQALFRAERQLRMQFVLLGFLRRIRMRRRRHAYRERIGETVVALRRRQPVAYFRQQQRAQLAFPIGVAPEQIECGIEELAFVGRGDEQRGKRRAHVVAAAEIDPLQRGERIDGLCGRHRQTGAAQHAHEMNHVAREHGRGLLVRTVASAYADVICHAGDPHPARHCAICAASTRARSS